MPPQAPAAAPGSAAIPSPRRRHAGRTAAVGLAAVLLTAALSPALKAFTRATPVTIHPVIVGPTTAGTQPPSLTPAQGTAVGQGRVVQAPGWLEPDPYAIAVTALADSVVETITVLEGQSVTKGQTVATLNADDARLNLAAAQASLAASQAHARDAEADLIAAQDNWDHPIQAEKAVETGRAALAHARAQLAQWPAQLQAAEADAARWRYEQTRTQRALANQAATEQEAQITQQRLRAAEAALATTRLQEAVLKARVQELTAQLKAAERDWDLRIADTQALARAKAKAAEFQAAVTLAQARRDEAQLRLDRMTITAPIDGRVLRRMKMPGDKVILRMDDPHSAHLVHLYDPEKIQVRVDVPLADAALIRQGQACQLIVDVLPDTPFPGVVTRITHQADLQKNTLQVKVRVIDPSPVLRPQMLTRVRFLPHQAGGDQTPAALAPSRSDPQSQPQSQPRPQPQTGPTLRVPIACLENNQRVFAVRQRQHGGGVATAIAVDVIEQDDALATVRGRLKPSDWLIEHPAGLQDGDRVTYAAPAVRAAPTAPTAWTPPTKSKTKPKANRITARSIPAPWSARQAHPTNGGDA